MLIYKVVRENQNRSRIMKKAIILAIFLVVAGSGFGQDQHSLYGTWRLVAEYDYINMEFKNFPDNFIFLLIFEKNELSIIYNGKIYRKFSYNISNNIIMTKLIWSEEIVSDIGFESIMVYWFSENNLYIQETTRNIDEVIFVEILKYINIS
jgi:hypothetical protein